MSKEHGFSFVDPTINLDDGSLETREHEPTHYQTIVVGSGPAGATAASYLALRGVDVLFVDRQVFPRDKVCGDAFSHSVLEIMENELKINSRELDFEHQEIRAVEVVSPSGRVHKAYYPQMRYPNFTAKRYDFDSALHHHAIKSGAQFRRVNVIGVIRDFGDIVGIYGEEDGKTVKFTSDYLIAADGSSSTIARAIGRRILSQEKAIAIRAYGKLNNPLEPKLELRYLGEIAPGYGWIFALPGNEVNVGIGMSSKRLKAAGVTQEGNITLESLLYDFVDQLRRDYEFQLLEDTVRSWQIAVWLCDDPRIVDGICLAGDAGRNVDPLTGGGNGPAMQTGVMSAQYVFNRIQGMSEQEAASIFQSDYQRIITKKMRRALWSQTHIISNPRSFNLISEAIGHLPQKIRMRAIDILTGSHK